MPFTKTEKLALILIIISLIMIVPSYLGLVTGAAARRIAAGTFSLKISHEQQMNRTSDIVWPIPPNGARLTATIDAMGRNSTGVPFHDRYFEWLYISVVFEDTVGCQFTPASTTITMVFINATDVAFIGWSIEVGLIDVELPSFRRVWFNVSTDSLWSRMELTIRWILIYSPAEHDLTLGILFMGTAFFTESIFVFILERTDRHERKCTDRRVREQNN